MAVSTKSYLLNLPSQIVIDASLIMSLLFEDESNPLTTNFFLQCAEESVEFFSPDVVHYEVANAIKSAVCSKRLSIEHVNQRLDKLVLLNIQTNLSVDLSDLVKIAVKYYISAYDGAYVLLAQQLNAPLCTRDKKLAEKLGTEVNCLVF